MFGSRPLHIAKSLWEGGFHSLTSLMRIILLSKYFINYKKDDNHEECVILGNGPSLNNFLNNYPDFLHDRATIAVNYFVRSVDDYKAIRPDHYVIVSPEYWQGEQKEGWHDDRMKTFQLIAEHTQWKMKLFVPAFAKKHKKWLKEIGNNDCIEVVYFNNIAIEGFQWLTHWAYRNNLGMPRPHNVLIGAILFAINLKYSTIYVAGAEHSWLKDIQITGTNEVLLSQKHFYESKKEHIKSVFSDGKARPMYVGGSSQARKLHEVLEKFYYTFRSYWELQNYAVSRGIHIFNITEESFIDAFKRYHINHG